MGLDPNPSGIVVEETDKALEKELRENRKKVREAMASIRENDF